LLIKGIRLGQLSGQLRIDLVYVCGGALGGGPLDAKAVRFIIYSFVSNQAQLKTQHAAGHNVRSTRRNGMMLPETPL